MFCKNKRGGNPLFSAYHMTSSGDELDAMAEQLLRVNKKVGQVNYHDQAKVHELQVMFAGEATHRTHYSTIHPYFSGFRPSILIMIFE